LKGISATKTHFHEYIPKMLWQRKTFKITLHSTDNQKGLGFQNMRKSILNKLKQFRLLVFFRK
jgi:hypothetical protein